MAISTEGVKVNIGLEVLAPGDGIVVKINTHMSENNEELRQAARVARKQGILGRITNAHTADFVSAQTRIANDLDAFATEISQYVSDWNDGLIEEVL